MHAPSTFTPASRRLCTSVLLVAAALAGACSGAAPTRSPTTPARAPAAPAATTPPHTTGIEEPRTPELDTSPPAAEPSGSHRSGEPAPASPGTAAVAEPSLAASLRDGAPLAEPLRPPADLRWENGKVVTAARPSSPEGSGAGVSGRGVVEVRGRAATPPRVRAASPEARGSMWGDTIGDSFGAGGLGLSGVGEGGSGRGSGAGLGAVGTGGSGLGAVGTLGRGSSGGATTSPRSGPVGSAGPARRAPVGAATEHGVKAGEWDDNASFLEFRRWLAREADGGEHHRVDLSTRRFLVVRDADGKAVPNCPVTVEAAGRSVRLLTGATGRALLFPHAEGVVAPIVTATASCADAGQASARFTVDDVDGAIDLRVPGRRALGDRRTVDIAFVLDTTGSMSEEIDAVKRTVEKVAARLAGRNLAVRFALVEYRDRGDDPLIRVHPMTRDASGFVERVRRVRAAGGGDTPEDVIEGLRAGLTRLDWSRASSVRLAFLIGDAPPQLGADRGSYVDAMRAANRAGIVLHTVAASGMDTLGQIVWRQVAQYTGGTNLFVLRGGAGPQSTGAGDARSSCGGTHTTYTSGNLDVLLADKVERAIAALDGDAMAIAGLGQDVQATPCPQAVSGR